MDDMYSRTQMLIGSVGVDKLKNSKVLICGLGGVGGYALESLVRAGIGFVGVVDCDVFSVTNLNRQILATENTLGIKKTQAAKERALSINANIKVLTYDMFIDASNITEIDFENYDYIVDAIDTVTSKLLLISKAKENNVPIISCMGTGNNLNIDFYIDDIYKTTVCPLARVMRKELKKLGIKNLKVLYSKSQPKCLEQLPAENGRHIPASISYAPAIAGLMIGGEVIKDLVNSTWCVY